jgi:hypothetical protein
VFINLIKIEIKRILYQKQILIAFLLMCILFFQGFQSFRPGPFVYYSPERFSFYLAFFNAQGGPSALLPAFFPLLLPLASGYSLAGDIKTGYDKNILLRISYKNYILGKLVAQSLISFGFIFIAEIIAFGYSLIGFPGVQHLEKIQGITPAYVSDLFINNPSIYILVIILNLALLGACISVLSTLLSVFIQNIYIITAVPWLLFILFQFIFYSIDLGKYAPMDLIGLYIFTDRYNLIEIPLSRIIIWLILCLLTYIFYTKKFITGANHEKKHD